MEPQCRCISAGIPIPWGWRFNDSLLSSGLIQITQLRLWLEDGSLIDAQRSDSASGAA
jgi:predicted component of type VI protein secretion system